MFAVIYSFTIKKDKEQLFLDAWEELTRLIYEYEGSLGSRLHKQSDEIYIAYAQWPDRETFEKSGDKLPKSADLARQKMREASVGIEILHELELTKDLLRNSQRQQAK